MPHSAIGAPGRAPSPALVARIKVLVAQLGILRTARELGIGRDAVTRLIGGVPVRAGTIALVERALAENRVSAARARASK